MSIISKRIDRNTRELLTFGYVRLRSNQSIPFVIVQLVHSFFDIIFNWNINEKQMKLLLYSTNNKDRLYGQSFLVKNIKFQCFLTSNYSNYVGFFVRYLSMNNPNISQINIYYELYCKEFDISWKNLAILTPENDNVGWPINTLQLSSCTNYESSNKGPEELTFECYVEVLYIAHKKECAASIKLDKYISEEIIIKDAEEYIWDLEKNNDAESINTYIKQLKTDRIVTMVNIMANHKRFYSTNFGSFDCKNWCLECIVNNKMDILLYLRLLALPNGINSMKVQFVLSANIGDNNNNDKAAISRSIQREYVQSFNADNNAWGWSCGVLSFSSVSSDQLISFGVKLSVLQIFDDKQQQIPTNKWLDFGVLSLNHIFE